MNFWTHHELFLVDEGCDAGPDAILETADGALGADDPVFPQRLRFQDVTAADESTSADVIKGHVVGRSEPIHVEDLFPFLPFDATGSYTTGS